MVRVAPFFWLTVYNILLTSCQCSLHKVNMAESEMADGSARFLSVCGQTQLMSSCGRGRGVFTHVYFMSECHKPTNYTERGGELSTPSLALCTFITALTRFVAFFHAQKRNSGDVALPKNRPGLAWRGRRNGWQRLSIISYKCGAVYTIVFSLIYRLRSFLRHRRTARSVLYIVLGLLSTVASLFQLRSPLISCFTVGVLYLPLGDLRYQIKSKITSVERIYQSL